MRNFSAMSSKICDHKVWVSWFRAQGHKCSGWYLKSDLRDCLFDLDAQEKVDPGSCLGIQAIHACRLEHEAPMCRRQLKWEIILGIVLQPSLGFRV